MDVNDTQIRSSRALARVLDTAFQIPGTRIRIGLDAILGLIPGAGDVLSAALGSYIVVAAVRAGAPTPVIIRMLGNVALDTAVGSIPVLGDLFDIAFKSNKRNAGLLERYVEQPGATVARSTAVVALAIAAVVIILAGIIALGVVAARLIWTAIA
jgi:hypothetical protein